MADHQNALAILGLTAVGSVFLLMDVVGPPRPGGATVGLTGGDEGVPTPVVAEATFGPWGTPIAEVPEGPAVRREVVSGWWGRALRLRVVDAATGRGVPNATVWFMRKNGWQLSGLHDDRAAYVHNLYDMGWKFRDQGMPVEADAAGFVTWQANAGPEVVAFCECGISWGLVAFDAGAVAESGAMPEIELRPDASVHISVVDEIGAVIEGAQVEWRLWDSDTGVGADRWNRAMTSGAGVVLRHMSLLGEGMHARSWRLQARAKVPGARSEESRIVPVVPGDAHLQLVLPALARAHLRLLDSDGAPLQGAAEVYLDVVEPSAESCQLWASMASGTVGFPVAPGRRYEVRLGSHHAEECRWIFEAPASAGAVETRELSLDPELIAVSWRTVDQRGQPVGRERLLLDLHGHGEHESVLCETDSAGRAQVVLSPPWVGGGLDRAVIRLFCGDDDRRADLRRRGALRAGSQDLGDVVFAPGSN